MEIEVLIQKIKKQKNLYEVIKKVVRKVSDKLINKFKKRNLSFKEISDYVIKYYQNDEKYDEQIKILKNGLTSFPFKWVQEYDKESIQVFRDADNFPFVMHKGKRLFFPALLSDEEVQKKYNDLLIEQDRRCAHCYFSDSFTVYDDCVFLDVGCAEAIVSLENIEKIKTLLLFECDTQWVDALEKTFAIYGGGVKIINRYISDEDSEVKKTATLDTVLSEFSNSEKIFIKADIEGYEKQMLKGMKNVIDKFPNLKIVLCTYHHQGDKEYFTKILKHKFNIEYSSSFMLWPWLAPHYKLRPPYFVTGVLRATKKQQEDGE